jgi:hypothetical protein
MQVSRFSNGGYVIHKMYVNGIKYSAWFDKDGDVLDAEGFDGLGRSRSVKRGGPVWTELQRVGRREAQPLRTDKTYADFVLDSRKAICQAVASLECAAATAGGRQFSERETEFLKWAVERVGAVHTALNGNVEDYGKLRK